jgi:hypothetical protein
MVPTPRGGSGSGRGRSRRYLLYQMVAARSETVGRPARRRRRVAQSHLPNFLHSCYIFHWQGYISTKRSFLRFALVRYRLDVDILYVQPKDGV